MVSNSSRDSATGVIEGTVRLGDNWCEGDFDLHFCARFSVSPVEMGTWVGTNVNRGVVQTESTAKDMALGAFARFLTNGDAPVLLKIAVSFRSVQQARHWLQAEVPEFGFEGAEAEARSRWNKALSAIDIEGASPEERTKFYTAMFHAMVQPRDRTADFARYGDAVMWDDHYTKWDSWRSQFPLMCLIDPGMVSGVVNSFLARQSVFPSPSIRLPIHPKVETAFTQGQECRRGQGGDEVDNIIADAFVKVIPGVDWRAAYAVMKYNAAYGRSMGYIDNGYFYVNEPYGDWRAQSGSCTPNFAYNDYCVATVARGLGETQDADTCSAFVFAAAGLFPNAGQPAYLLNGPSYPSVSFNLPGAKIFRILGVNASVQNIYVQSATLNGATLDRCWITHQEIVAGGELRFEMGPNPSSWAHDGPMPPTGLDAPAPAMAAISRKVPAEATISWANNVQKTLRIRGNGLHSLIIHAADGRKVGAHSLRSEAPPPQAVASGTRQSRETEMRRDSAAA